MYDFLKVFCATSFSWIQQLPSVRFYLASLLSSSLQATLWSNLRVFKHLHIVILSTSSYMDRLLSEWEGIKFEGKEREF